MKLLSIALVLSALLAGCATLEPPVAPGYVGPTAIITDSVLQEDGGKGQLFFVRAVDGRTIESAQTETRRASAGRGFSLALWSKLRLVPVRQLQLTLVGTHATAAPIHEIASRAAGTFFSVEGIVEFTPVAGAEYVVRGILKKEGSTVWLADAKTLEPVSAIVGNSSVESK